MEETILMENGNQTAFVPIGSDTKPSFSLMASPRKEEDKASSKDPEISVSRQQDNDVLQIAAHQASEVFGKWETHITRRTRNTFTAEEKKSLRSVAYQFGTDLLLRMSTDKDFMDKVHEDIEIDHFYRDMLTDRYRRKESISPLVHEMVGLSQTLLQRVSDVAVNNGKKDLRLNKDGMNEEIKAIMSVAFIGAESLISKGGCINA
ncbi:MAG: hypothetical protein WC174_00050 [Bacilli bacterium]